MAVHEFDLWERAQPGIAFFINMENLNVAYFKALMQSLYSVC